MKRDTVVTKLRKLAENADVSNVDFPSFLNDRGVSRHD